MNLKISIEYATYKSANLVLVYSLLNKNEIISVNQKSMLPQNNNLWTVDLLINKEVEAIDYRFKVAEEDSIIDEEQINQYHHFDFGEQENIVIHCQWNVNSERSFLYSSAYKDCIFSFSGNTDVLTQTDCLYLQVPEYICPKDFILAVSGNQEYIGNWNAWAAPEVKQLKNYVWQIGLDATKISFPFEYKFILRNKHTGEVIWEDGGNRFLDAVQDDITNVYEQSSLRLPESPAKVGGMVIPVFSLRSHQSCGVGDFGDLKKMIDWVAKAGLHVLQILPLNDTTQNNNYLDSYPYNIISAFAFHPMYISLSDLKELKDISFKKKFEQKRKRLNGMHAVRYMQANRLKDSYLRAYYEQEGAEVMKSQDFIDFEKSQNKWLAHYCYFRYLQKYNCASDFRKWRSFGTFHSIDNFSYMKDSGQIGDVYYYAFVQFLLNKQLSAVHKYAREKGVVLKGDVPIGLSRNSVTAWVHPTYFNMDGQAGAPPDYFSKDGQNWGFPTYNWENLLKDGGSWWNERLKFMSQYFDTYRIDHILGFFRIWEIPTPFESGMLGHFNPALPLTETEIRNYGFTRSIMPHKQKTFNENSLKKLLFFPDKHVPGSFNLNIGAKGTERYKALNESNKKAYDQMFEDYFYHRHENFWAEKAVKKLNILRKATSMLPCVEDLGMIPNNMRSVLNELHILSLEVESMPKYSWGRFADVSQNPFLSVDTITTHDMPSLRLWWKENPDAAADYYRNVLHHSDAAPDELSTTLCKEIVFNHLKSNSLFCLISWQDWSAISDEFKGMNLEAEQINVPAKKNHYWRYRMETNLEDLLENTKFQETVKQLLSASGRYH